MKWCDPSVPALLITLGTRLIRFIMPFKASSDWTKDLAWLLGGLFWIGLSSGPLLNKAGQALLEWVL